MDEHSYQRKFITAAELDDSNDAVEKRVKGKKGSMIRVLLFLSDMETQIVSQN
jgi:hypothetical protein